MLKSINVNKMNHQYIQNLQKANMTLKCKIKELTEMATGKSLSSVKDEGTWFDLEAAEDELELKELGSIEEVSKQIIQQRKKRYSNQNHKAR